MSADGKNRRNGVLNEPDTTDSECNRDLLEPSDSPKNCTPSEFTVNYTDSALSAKKLSGFQKPCRNTKVPIASESLSHIENEEGRDVRLDVIDGNHSYNLTSFVKSGCGSTKSIRLSRNGSTFNSYCGPNPKKIFRWIVIIVFVWITFIIVINTQKKVCILYSYKTSCNLLVSLD